MPRPTLGLLLALVLTLGLAACEGGTPPPSASGGTSTSVSIPPAGGDRAARAVPTSQPAAATQRIMSSPLKSSPNYMPPPEDVAAPPADAKKTPTGLASKVLKKGTGKVKPKPTDFVKVHYTGWTTDGKQFDSSVARNTPATFQLNKVIPGWTEGVGLMVAGEQRRLWIPEELAYKGRPGAPAGMLVFDVELLELVQPPEVPKDVKAPPKDAKKTASGLAWKVLKKGTGTVNPTAASYVQVHYSGWTTDGKMFDSSITRGQPASFPLGRVIPGWTEGVQLMVEGEKRRFWIPEELAYKGRPGPQGMLVFDVELLKIVGTGGPGFPGGRGGPGGHGPGDGHGH